MTTDVTAKDFNPSNNALVDEIKAKANELAAVVGKLPRDAFGRFVKLCDGCQSELPDPPSSFCPGCDAYRDHQQ